MVKTTLLSIAGTLFKQKHCSVAIISIATLELLRLLLLNKIKRSECFCFTAHDSNTRKYCSVAFFEGNEIVKRINRGRSNC